MHVDVIMIFVPGVCFGIACTIVVVVVVVVVAVVVNTNDAQANTKSQRKLYALSPNTSFIM